MKHLLLLIVLFVFAFPVYALTECQGNDSRLWDNCFAKKNYPPNDYYLGEFKAGKRQWSNGVYVKKTHTFIWILRMETDSAKADSFENFGKLRIVINEETSVIRWYTNINGSHSESVMLPLQSFYTRFEEIDQILRQIGVSGEYLSSALSEILGYEINIPGYKPLIYEQERQPSAQPNVSVDEVKRKCKELGFVEGTPEFADCGLTFYR